MKQMTSLRGLAACALTGVLLGTSGCQTSGSSMLGASIADIEAPFARLDLFFNT